MSIVLFLLAILLLLALLFAPVLFFLLFGWPVRKRAILAPFSDKAVKRYYAAYFPNEKREAPATRDSFEKEYDARYGRWLFILPLVLLGAVSSYLIMLCVNTLFQLAEPSFQVLPFLFDRMTVAAAAGGYVWVVADLIARARSLDFSTAHINWASYRLAAAIPLGFAFAQFAGNDSVKLAVAILVGAFPAQELGRIGRRLVGKQLGIEDSPVDQKTRLVNLQDIDSAIADRLGEEGITSISQLAYADPVALTMRTGLPFIFIVDCVSQALLWVYLGDHYFSAQAHGLRGALEVCGFLQEREDADENTPEGKSTLKQKEEVIKALADHAKTTTFVIEEELDFVWNDPLVGFLVDLTDND